MDEAAKALALIGGTALLNEPGQDERQRQAACDSMLYAQLVANKQAGSRFDDYDAWYAAYTATYRQLGWLKIAGTHDQRQLGMARPNGPIQPLEAWMRIRAIEHKAVVAAVTGQLSRSGAAFGHLLKFCARDEAGVSSVVVEIGLLKPGPVMDLCSIALRTTKPITGYALSTLMSEQLKQGEAVFNGVSLALDSERFAPQRDELKSLMASKDQHGAYRFYLNAERTGEEHE